ncbi:MAG: type 4a pilus biogenesis protein PilO [Patescibacteria group bacterium]
MKFISNIINRLKTWEEESTRREKIFLVILTILLPLILFYKVYFSSIQEKIKKYKEEINNLNIEIAKLEVYQKKEKDLEMQLNEWKKFLDEVKNFLPTEKEVPSLLKNVSSIAKQSQLEILSFSPKNEEPRDYYVVIPFEIHLKGFFSNIISFLNKVETLERLITLENIEFNPQEKEDKLIVKCLFYTYKYTGELLQSNNTMKVKY